MTLKPESIIQYDKTLPYIDGREPHLKPNSYLVKDKTGTYKIQTGRRTSDLLLINKLRAEVESWRDNGYKGITDTTQELLAFWFENDHLLNGEKFQYWFCQREAIETLIYLYEVKKFKDIRPVIEEYVEFSRKDVLGPAVEITEDLKGKRKLIRYIAKQKQQGEQELPQKDLLRYAFKMATGSGKTIVMALVCVWSYFNKLREKGSEMADNFLIVAPNVIVFERLSKDFNGNKIFYELPLIPPSWRSEWDIKVTMRGDSAPLNPNGNIIVDNIHQIYDSRENRETDETAENIVNKILGKEPQKDLTKSPVTLLSQIKKLSNLIVMNDEAHHVHEEELEWHKTLISINNSIPNGLVLWLDYSATPRDQNGAYFPWIIVDYPLAQAIEDRIVKTPLIVHHVNKRDPEKINKDNVVQKYGEWLSAALTRWKKHFEVYSKVGKKPVLFIMAEKNDYADKIAEAIRKRKREYNLDDPEKEVLIIHTDRVGEIRKSDLTELRKEARDIDNKDNQVKIIVSVLMLKEGWDVQNVTIALGLRPFTAESNILPEQAVGRGLRLMRGISPDHTQTLEVMGTQAFEDFIKELEKEGVGIETVKAPPPLPVTIAPEKSRIQHDIEIPNTDLRFSHNYKNVTQIDNSKIPSLFSSKVLNEDKKMHLRIHFPITDTVVHEEKVSYEYLETGRGILSSISTEIMKKAHFTCNFQEIYPIVENYVSERCFERKVDIENDKVRQQLTDFAIKDAIVELLTKELGKIIAEQRETIIISSSIHLSKMIPFTWRRKHSRLDKTVFNFVALFNDFEGEFADFLQNSRDILRFAALAEKFKIDYLSSKGAIRFYYPDFVAVQKINGKIFNWIIETKGREYEDTDKKDAAMIKWCEDISKQVNEEWHYIKVTQIMFNKFKKKSRQFDDLVKNIVKESENK
jgi:type III restriction enzyme